MWKGISKKNIKLVIEIIFALGALLFLYGFQQAIETINITI